VQPEQERPAESPAGPALAQCLAWEPGPEALTSARVPARAPADLEAASVSVAGLEAEQDRAAAASLAALRLSEGR
jgi:hypothetical protein